ERLDLDDLARLDAFGDLDARGLFHASLRLPHVPQPPTFTSTLRVLMSSVPSLSSATATTSCVLASRMTVVTRALPDSGVKVKVATRARGLAGDKRWIALT